MENLGWLVTAFLLPLTMVGCGYWLWKAPAQEMNDSFGYRTKRSKKNIDTWRFAQEYCGKSWVKWGWVLCASTVAVMLAAMFWQKVAMEWLVFALVMLQSVYMCVMIYPTEKALEETFDEEGNRRER